MVREAEAETAPHEHAHESAPDHHHHDEDDLFLEHEHFHALSQERKEDPPQGGPETAEHDDADPPGTQYHLQRHRVFLRGIEGDYGLSAELQRLRDQPRVRKATELKFVDGPQAYSRHFIEPKDGITQTFHLHLEEYGPGGRSQKHGHVNEAAFYILDGTGYEIHDDIRYDWEAGDVVIVHNNCVHQHFNASEERPARALVIKTKPMYLFMNMLFQKMLEPRSTEPGPGGEGFVARSEPDDHNHPEGGY